jgi:hypothetical protein
MSRSVAFGLSVAINIVLLAGLYGAYLTASTPHGQVTIAETVQVEAVQGYASATLPGVAVTAAL